MDDRFAFDPDVATASTIPAHWYHDPAYAQLERLSVFTRAWQLVGHAGRVRLHGEFFTTELAGEPLVVVRDGDALRGFVNVCRHRAGPVATGCGRRNTLQCRYHGWTYALDGALLRAPEMEGTRGFDPATVRLPSVRVETWGPLVFACLDPRAPSLLETLGDIPARSARFGIEAMSHVMSRRYEVECNWKVYVDNYLEGYHVPVVHPGLHRELDYGRYRVEPAGLYSRQFAPLRPVATTGAPAADGARDPSERKYVPADGDDSAEYFWLFPNVTLNLYQGLLQTNAIEPLGTERTAVQFEWFAAAPPDDPARDPRWSELVRFSDEIQAEDAAICAVVQRNLHSRTYTRGRYSAARENGVHHFHGLLCGWLGANSGGGEGA